jgi:TetR/AcrR family transcriptional regulator, transcriptional repressor for nem operon
MADVDVLQLTPKGRATRERIVKTAAELMARQGVAGTSIDDVRRAAGVSGSQMTHYFQDKRTLVRAVIAMQADTVIGLQPSLDSFEALERWAEQNIARQQEANCESGCIFGSLAGELAETDAETRAELAAGFTRWEALFREGLQAMSDGGELRPDADPALLAAGLLAALQGGLLLTKTTRDIRHLEAALKTAVDHVRSYAAVPSSGGRARARAASRTLVVDRRS